MDKLKPAKLNFLSKHIVLHHLHLLSYTVYVSPISIMGPPKLGSETINTKAMGCQAQVGFEELASSLKQPPHIPHKQMKLLRLKVRLISPSDKLHSMCLSSEY